MFVHVQMECNIFIFRLNFQTAQQDTCSAKCAQRFISL